MYAMLLNRPYVEYALSVTSKYQSSLGKSHMIIVKNILKYLRKTKDVFLVYKEAKLKDIEMLHSNPIRITAIYKVGLYLP